MFDFINCMYFIRLKNINRLINYFNPYLLPIFVVLYTKYIVDNSILVTISH